MPITIQIVINNTQKATKALEQLVDRPKGMADEDFIEYAINDRVTNDITAGTRISTVKALVDPSIDFISVNKKP